MTGSLIREGRGYDLVRSPFSFWNSLIVQYFRLPHPHTSKSSHIALITAAPQHAPAKHSNIPCLYCLSPLLFPRGGLHTTKGFRDISGFFPEKTKLKMCRFPRAHIWVVFAAVHCCAASTSTHQPAADVSQPTPCPWHWAAPLCLQYGIGGQTIQTSSSGLSAVCLRAPNAARRTRTFKLSVVCRIKARGELWCPCRHLVKTLLTSSYMEMYWQEKWLLWWCVALSEHSWCNRVTTEDGYHPSEKKIILLGIYFQTSNLKKRIYSCWEISDTQIKSLSTALLLS